MSLTRPTMSAIRFGYGIRPGAPFSEDPEALLAELELALGKPPRFPTEGIEGRYETIQAFYERQADARTKDKDLRRQRLRPIRRDIFAVFGADQHARVVQSVQSPYGFHERLAAFWFDHFSVSARKQRFMNLYVPLYEAEAIRPNLAGPFADLLKAVIHHPAMLIYLDQVKSHGPNSRRGQRNDKGLNENLGRELLELHTLGVDGGYTQDDVRDASLILTGLTVSRDTRRGDFRKTMAEPGPLTFMGHTFAEDDHTMDDIDAMLEMLAGLPQTGKHICRKLATHFLSDTPPQPLVDAMVAAWKASGGNLADVYAAMLRHPAAWENPGEKARQPLDFVVAGLRALDAPESALAMPKRHDREDAELARDMAPASPAPGMMKKKADARSMTMGDMAASDPEEAQERMEEEADKKKKGPPLRPPLNRLSVRALKKLGQPLWEPASPAGVEEDFSAWISSSQLTGRIEWAQRAAADIGGRADPSALLKAVLRDAAREDTITVVRQAPNRIAGTALVLASPEFNRR